MSRIIRTPQAHLDLIEIGLYIAEDNLESALKLLDSIEAKFRLLARSPELGRKREELAPGLRSFPAARNYLVFYKPIDDGIEIIQRVRGFEIANCDLKKRPGWEAIPAVRLHRTGRSHALQRSHSERAVQVNILIMRAFVRLREMLAKHKDLARKLKELEKKFAQHDALFQEVFEAIHQCS
jgi:toxin ParE1/3/4